MFLHLGRAYEPLVSPSQDLSSQTLDMGGIHKPKSLATMPMGQPPLESY